MPTKAESNNFNKLVAFCIKQGVTVEKSHEGYAEFQFLQTKNKKKFLHQTIKYNKFLPKIFLTYSLLHEMGHRELISQGFEKTYGKTFDKGFMQILEEILAWQKGLEIAKKAKIKINQKGYAQHAQRALRTYIAGIFMFDEKEVSKIQKAIDKFY